MLGAIPGFGQATGIGDMPAYQRRYDPYHPSWDMPANMISTFRAMMPSIANAWVAGHAGFVSTPETEGLMHAAANAFAEIGKQIVKGAPTWRDALNVHPPITGSTHFTQDAFAREKASNALLKFFNDYGYTGEAKIKGQPPSKVGAVEAQKQLGRPVPDTSVGLGRSPPTNPLYLEFMQGVANQLKQEDPRKGGLSLKSLWSWYGEATRQVREASAINAGNAVTWQQRMASPKEAPVRTWLAARAVDPYDPVAVRNSFELYRQNIMRHMNLTYDAVGAQMSKKYGFPISIDTLDPYNIPDPGSLAAQRYSGPNAPSTITPNAPKYVRGTPQPPPRLPNPMKPPPSLLGTPKGDTRAQ